MNTKKIKVGDIVYLPCKVVGTSTIGGMWTDQGGELNTEAVLDLRPIESTSGEPFGVHLIKPFTVYERDVEVRS